MAALLAAAAAPGSGLRACYHIGSTSRACPAAGAPLPQRAAVPPFAVPTRYPIPGAPLKLRAAHSPGDLRMRPANPSPGGLRCSMVLLCMEPYSDKRRPHNTLNTLCHARA